MTPSLVQMAVILILSALITLLVTPLVRQLALALNIVDQPNRRKVHHRPVPRLGGLSIYLAWLAALVLGTGFAGAQQASASFVSVAGLGALVVFAGVWDDWKNLPGAVKLLAQVVIASLTFSAGIRIDRISNPFGGEFLFPELLSYAVTVVWIAGMMNAMNLIDGLDGLACGIAGIVALGLIAAGVYLQSSAASLILVALAGSCLGFLRYNAYPATIFLGDSGSQFLGFVFATTALIDYQYKAATAVALLIPLTALALPIYDTALAVFRRVGRRRSVFAADKHHLHHRLLRMGLSHRQVVLFLYVASAYFSVLAFLFVLIHERYALILLALLALGLLMAIQALRFIELHLLRLRRLRYRLRFARPS